jgi:chromate transporter
MTLPSTPTPPITTTAPADELARPAPVSFMEAFWYWLKLGFISFGGPAGQIAIMHADLVERKRWISEKRFLHALNYCMVLPGPEAQQLATYIGWLMHRTWGGLIAGGLFVLPSLFILAGLTWVYLAFGNVPLIAGLFDGIKPAVTAIVVHAAWRIGSKTLKNVFLWSIAAGALIAVAWLDVPFPAVILGAALIGWLGGKFAPDKFNGGGHGAAKASYGPAIIDDDTPTPAHARFALWKLVTIIVTGLVVWGGAYWVVRESPLLANMATFFTKAALLTFGGAYAVLPYVADAAVNDFKWLTATQMIDGLALGETTPGPLIMIVAFVGFVGGWTHQTALSAGAMLSGPAIVLMAMAGACVATFFTFLPSFVFIYAGAPFIETTHGNLKFTAPLTAISAAVVGVIVNLALFFGYHVFFAKGWAHPNLFALAIGVGAAVALFHYKVSVIRLILACGAIGAVARFAGL